ncbi:nuclear transport factor 2 family protein [Cumulibacter manganitolerans]|uniref:nuclear transport factor 2 family protein n=1 Tax=Cumulibacter manganitolerans TaxID=1884992 RepID=UPI0012981CD5|nr:nuclear transport factor 2 family protein [Cumulibacter manganitolerans]
MSQEQDNKQTVTSFLEAFSSGDVDAVLGAMSDDATWWTAGRIKGMSGTAPKEVFAKGLPGLLSACQDGKIAITPTAMTAEGDRVAVEAESSAETRSGRSYRNQYHFLFTVRDGKIAAVKEYMDTDHARATFIDA